MKCHFDVYLCKLVLKINMHVLYTGICLPWGHLALLPVLGLTQLCSNKSSSGKNT